jgi:hypothetical protein
MRVFLAVLAGLALCVGAATAKLLLDTTTAIDLGDQSQGRSRTVVFFYDNIESGNTGWTHGDYTTTAVPHFHVDTYMAYGGSGHSWWCGNFNYDADGGYGNNWTDLLVLAPTNVPEMARGNRADLAIAFAYRCDSEAGYDFTYVQAESGGVYVNLNGGYDGQVPWTSTMFYLGDKDVPPQCRFRFHSDGAGSDEDGDNTVGGGFACDDIEIYDTVTGDVIFRDDVESGGLCSPATSGLVAGDYWHIEQCCKSASMSHCWSVAWPDTSFVQPNLQNWLMSPVVTITNAATCTLSYRRHRATPTVDNDYYVEELYVDGTWYTCGAWWGDICDANGVAYVCYPSSIQGRKAWILDSLLPANQVAYRWTYYTTDNGAGPDACHSAGLFIDDFRVCGLIL